MPLAKAPEMAAHALAQRHEGLETCGAECGVDADAFGRVVIAGNEDDGLRLAGDGVGAPHDVHGVGDDGAVMGPRPAG